ncbi:MAG: transcription termination factor Rho [Fusicatenibacter sp.]|nr:transcription termination factor Rho [Lachnospiraceae bacterium]MDY2937828.1 transcription termination factor Rho [Fusicatenibacter sp.]
MTREKYESLSLSVLKELAKSRNMKGVSTLRKEALIERMLEEDGRQMQISVDYASEGDRADTASAETASAETIQKDRVRVGARKNVPQRVKSEKSDKKESFKKEIPGAETVKTETAADMESTVSKKEEIASFDTAKTEPVAFEERRTENRRISHRRTEGTKRPGWAPEADAQMEKQQLPRTELIREEKKYVSVDERQMIREDEKAETTPLDSGREACGILEVMPDGFGFIRSDNYMPGENDVYVSPSQIRRFGLKTGDIIRGNTRVKSQNEKFSALLYVKSVNNFSPESMQRRGNFEDMTPIFPNERLRLERPGGSLAMRIVDLVSPIGKGQRGMIVSPPKAGKTTLLKEAAKSILKNCPQMHLIILLIDERPEEVTDIKEAIQGPNVEVIYSTFDELPEHHRRVSEMVIERAKRLVEHKKDVAIFIDSITRLARAYNMTVPPSGRTLSGGLDPAALHMPKRFFGAARNMREGGSLTILATALVDTGSKMDDVVYEEFKGTGNMELVLDRKLQEKRVFPAIDIAKSGTRREDLLLTGDEQEAVYNMRKALNGLKSEEAVENILNMFSRTRNNGELVQILKKQKIV